MKMSEDERQCLSESRGGSVMSFLFLVIARVAIATCLSESNLHNWILCPTSTGIRKANTQEKVSMIYLHDWFYSWFLCSTDKSMSG